MAEVRVIARVVAREGRAQELKTLLAGLVGPTRQEVGCRFYELYASDTVGVFYFNELWQSQADLDAHMLTGHFTTTFSKLKELDLLTGPAEIHLLTAVE